MPASCAAAEAACVATAAGVAATSSPPFWWGRAALLCVRGTTPLCALPTQSPQCSAARAEAAIRGRSAEETQRLIDSRTAWAREAKRRKLQEEVNEELQQDVKEPTPGAPTECPSLLQAPEGGTAASSSSSSGGGGTLPSPQATPITPEEVPDAAVDAADTLPNRLRWVYKETMGAEGEFERQWHEQALLQKVRELGACMALAEDAALCD